MRNIVIIFVTAFYVLGCDEDSTTPQNTCNDVIVSSEQYNNSQTDDFTLTDVVSENECLKISLRYGGGCKEVTASLIDSEDVIETDPIQRNLKIVFADDDECEALVEKSFYFEISNLQINNEKEVLLNFEGSSLTFLYEY